MKPKCVVCGCTEDNACDGGCSWSQLNPDLCSRCASREPFWMDEAMIEGPGRETMNGRPFDLAIATIDPEMADAIVKLLNRAYAAGRRAGVALDIQPLGSRMAELLESRGQANSLTKKWWSALRLLKLSMRRNR